MKICLNKRKSIVPLRKDNLLKDSDILLQTLFKESPVSIWRENLSELKEYLDSLKNKTKDIRKYFDENPSEILKCAQIVKVFDVNKSIMDLLIIDEESKSELIGPLLKNIYQPSEMKGFKEAVIELSKGNLHNLVEGYKTTKQGTKIYLQYLTYVPEIYSSTWEEAWVFVFNLTEQKALESKLNEKVSKNEFLIDLLTHDLANYHATSQGFLDIILAGRSIKDEENINYLTKAKKGIQKATKLLENVSVLMKSQAYKNFELQPIELKTILIKVEAFIISLYPNQKVLISIDIPDNLVVRADSLIEYLFINLFTNAVKHNRNKDKKIRVTSSQDGDVCSIKITDNAKGIPPKMRKDIFTRYSKFKKHGKGSGLGMFISKTLVDRYSGQISIESSYPDDFSKGTQINIILKCVVE